MMSTVQCSGGNSGLGIGAVLYCITSIVVASCCPCWATKASKECQCNSGCAWPARVLGADGVKWIHMNVRSRSFPAQYCTAGRWRVLFSLIVSGLTVVAEQCMKAPCLHATAFADILHALHTAIRRKKKNNTLVTFERSTSCRSAAGSSQYSTPPSSYSQLITLIILITIKQ